MKLPNIYSYGTLFGFSGIDGENSKNNDFIGMTMNEAITIRFDSVHPVFLKIASDGKPDYILSDIIKFSDALLIFTAFDTVCGKTDKKVSVYTDEIPFSGESGDEYIIENDGFFFALALSGEKFALCRDEDREKAIAKAKSALATDLESAEKSKLDYYRSLKPCAYPDYERLYYKCLSVNKVNVYSPQNGIPCRFTTPDRLPHRHMWLWDSMFHAMAIANYNPALAEDCVNSVLVCQREDGFIPHMMKSIDTVSKITQPQVIAWAALEVYKKTGDIDFLRKNAEKIDRFLTWFLKNRDLNGNGLLEWETDFSNVRCRCDESGMDNSPRFDTTERLDAIDASCFMVHDCGCMAEIYRIIGNTNAAERFESIKEKTAAKINELLWDEDKGAYTDLEFSGKLTGVLSCCSFLPLFASICTEERAARLVKLLKDESTFATPLPVPSISKDHPDFGTDMWRGGVWINFNYFIITGLRKYGYTELAEEIKNKTLSSALKFFNETGNIHEFYDPEDKLNPLFLNRKGEQPPVPDYRKLYHSITDFNWSACFTYLLLTE